MKANMASSKTRSGTKASKRSWVRWVFKLLGWTVLSGLILGLLAAGGVAGLVYYYISDPALPKLDTIQDYRPKVITKVFARDGETLLGEIFEERRTLVPFEKIPKHVIHAFLDAEDAEFYEHHGLNFIGIARAVLHNVFHPTERMHGASTITQQLVKNLLFQKDSRRPLKIKIQETYLAVVLEKLGNKGGKDKKSHKDNELYVYLNQIYFGHQGHPVYGVEEAAQYYFGKSITEVNVGEAAALASFPKEPEKMATDPARLKQRQQYVLRRMVERGHLNAEEAERWKETSLTLLKQTIPDIAPEFVDEAERQLREGRFKDHPEDLAYAGLRVITTCDTELQRATRTAVEQGLQRLDGRSGFRKPLRHVSGKQLLAATKTLDEHFPQERDLTSRIIEGIVKKVYDGDEKHQPQALVLLGKGVLGRLPLPIEKGKDRYNPDGLLPSKRFQAGDVLRVRVLYREPQLAPPRRPVYLAPMPPIGPPDPAKETTVTSSIKEQVAKADTSQGRGLLRPQSPVPPSLPPVAAPEEAVLDDNVTYRLQMEQGPQSAVVLMDPANRQVLAMAGGYHSGRKQYNRAMQAFRQPGSSFKVAVYGAAYETKLFTPASLVEDSPEIYEIPGMKPYVPKNSEGDKFAGPVRLRVALAHSYNTVAVKLLMDERVGYERVVAMARNLGFEATMKSVPSLALGGALEVSPLELNNAYATLAAQGIRSEPRMILQMGEEVIPVPASERTVSPELAFLLTSVLQSPIEEGTAASIKGKLKRMINGKGVLVPVAGKTGTTNEGKDAWFVGYTPNLVCVVWVGFDDMRSLGKEGYGAKAALPIWFDVMSFAERRFPPKWFAQPAGIVIARIDPQTGKLAVPGGPAIEEVFLAGTEPKEQALAPGESNPDTFFMEDR